MSNFCLEDLVVDSQQLSELDVLKPGYYLANKKPIRMTRPYEPGGDTRYAAKLRYEQGGFGRVGSISARKRLFKYLELLRKREEKIEELTPNQEESK